MSTGIEFGAWADQAGWALVSFFQALLQHELTVVGLGDRVL